MKNKFDVIKIVGLAGMALGAVATLIRDWAQQQEMERTIEEKVNEALALRSQEEES